MFQRFALKSGKKKPLINYNLTMVFEPIVLGGTQVGVLLNMLFPAWLTLIILILVLLISSTRTCWKGLKICRKELKERRQKKQEEAEGEEIIAEGEEKGKEKEPLLAHVDPDVALGKDVSDRSSINLSQPKEEEEASDTTKKKSGDDSSSDDDRTDFDEVLTKRPTPGFYNFFLFLERIQVQFLQLFLLSGVWILIFLVSFFKGGKKSPSVIGLEVCSVGWWILSFISFPFLVCFALIAGAALNVAHRVKRYYGYDYTEGEVKWKCFASYILPFIFFFAGICAGLLGIGGGMIISPLLLEVGVDPGMTAATSSIMVLFTSSSTAFQYVFLGRLGIDYFFWFFCFGLVSAVLGRIVIGLLLKKLKSAVFIIFIIAVTIFACTIMMGVVGVLHIVKDIQLKNWKAFGFQPLCG